MRTTFGKRAARLALGFVLCTAMAAFGFVAPAPTAYAATSAEKKAEAEALMKSIDELQTSLNEANDEYDRATEEYETAKAAADRAAIRLREANKLVEHFQERLAQCATNMYKSGGSASMLDVLLGASSFDEAVTLWDSFGKISEQEAVLVQESKDAQAEAEAAEKDLAEQEAIAEQEAENAKAARDEIAAAKEDMDAQLEQVNEELVMLKAKEESESLAADEALRRLQEADALVGGSGSTIAGWSHPIPSGAPVTNEFGWAGAWDGEYHNGIDLGAPTGTPIVAAAPGTVSYVGDYGSGGKAVKINHGSGLVTIYMHMSSQAATMGQRVSAGDVIGYVGSTGYSTGPHLHFQIELDGTPVNPRHFIHF